MAPKTINWAAIKKRYLLGEKPKDIAAHFGVTANQVSQKAAREKWNIKKHKIEEKIEKKIEIIIESQFDGLRSRLLQEYERLAFSDMSRVANWNASGVDFKSSAELSPDDTACVSEISESTNQHGGSLKIKLHNKLGAMDTLAEIVHLKKDKAAPPASTGEDPPLLKAYYQGTLNLQKLWGDHDHPTDTVQRSADAPPDVVDSG